MASGVWDHTGSLFNNHCMLGPHALTEGKATKIKFRNKTANRKCLITTHFSLAFSWGHQPCPEPRLLQGDSCLGSVLQGGETSEGLRKGPGFAPEHTQPKRAAGTCAAPLLVFWADLPGVWSSPVALPLAPDSWAHLGMRDGRTI